MTTDTVATTRTPTARAAWGGITSLGRSEALLLRRNPMALFNALVVPVAFAVFLRSGLPPGDAARLGGATIVTSLTAVTLLSVVYLNLVTALVARRDELVLKRLRTGETSDGEILSGTAAPAVAIAWGQILIGLLAAVTVFALGMPTNPALVLAAIVLGTAAFGLLATASTVVTRTVEMAQVTTMPVLLGSLLLGGLMFPLDTLPGSVQQVAHLLPLTAVVDLLHLGLTGTTTDGATVSLAASFRPAAVPVLILTAWIVAGVWATRQWFRWEPRH
jgi:ABC-2 type transport system permease protein